jgi:hypothetical protein
MLLEQQGELILEGDAAMVFLLILDVGSRGAQHRLTD